MKVTLLHHTPLEVVIKAIRKCYASEGLSDSYFTWFYDEEYVLGEKDSALLRRILASGHGSVLEHQVFTFDIDGISRGCLQELERHRITSSSVQSTRYTLGKQLKEEEYFSPSSEESLERAKKYLVFCGDPYVDMHSVRALEQVRCGVGAGIPNDLIKLCLPESFKTTLIWTINVRSLRNFLELRLSERAHWEIRQLATTIYQAVPESHKILLEGIKPPT